MPHTGSIEDDIKLSKHTQTQKKIFLTYPPKMKYIKKDAHAGVAYSAYIIPLCDIFIHQVDQGRAHRHRKSELSLDNQISIQVFQKEYFYTHFWQILIRNRLVILMVSYVHFKDSMFHYVLVDNNFIW